MEWMIDLEDVIKIWGWSLEHLLHTSVPLLFIFQEHSDISSRIYNTTMLNMAWNFMFIWNKPDLFQCERMNSIVQNAKMLLL